MTLKPAKFYKGQHFRVVEIYNRPTNYEVVYSNRGNERHFAECRNKDDAQLIASILQQYVNSGEEFLPPCA